MKISVFGCGYLGAVHAAALAELGHTVVGIDVDDAKVALLSNAKAPFYEPQFEALLHSSTTSGRLQFTTDASAAAHATVHFLAVGTPSRANGSADLSYLRAAVTALIPSLKPDDLVVGKSTVPVGTAEMIADAIAHTGARVLWNPEFLREGWAVTDSLRPDRIVVGVGGDSDGHAGITGKRDAALMRELYAGCLGPNTPFLVTNLATAQLVKVAANAFLATKISFINAMAELAEEVGADVTELADALGFDERIGRKFLGAGIGFGGGCLPKDIRALRSSGTELQLGGAVEFLRAIDELNMRARHRFVDRIEEEFGGDLHGRRVAVLGASFKPQSDDIRDSPALWVANNLQHRGAQVVVTDPVALDNARRANPHLEFVEHEQAALFRADAVALVTEWDEYRFQLDPTEAGRLVRGKLVFDGRNALNPDSWTRAGWTYVGVGRPKRLPQPMSDTGAVAELDEASLSSTLRP